MKYEKEKEKKDLPLLLDMLAEISDPRNKKGRRYSLESILGFVTTGLLCGHKGYTSIATWGRRQPELAKALGFTPEKTPCASTIHNLLKALDVDALERTLTQWINSVIESRPDLKGSLDAVAIDGKTMRASKKGGAKTNHLLSVVSHELGITVTQLGVNDKTNEIPVSTEILERFDVSGKVITTDALLTQRTFCSEVIERGGDYALVVKKNHAELFDSIEKLFQDIPDTTSEDIMHPILKEPIHVYETVEKSHGRLETRCIKASTSLNAYLDWPGIAQVFQYSSIRKPLKEDEETHDVSYGITSLTPDEASAECLLTIKRGHWSIENRSHWMRDTQLGEDASPVRCGSIPQVMAAFRNTALSVLRFAGITRIADEMRYLASRPKLAANMIS